MPDAGPQKRDFEAEDALFQGMWFCSEVELPSDRRARHLHDDRVFSWRRAPTSLCVERQRSPIEIELLPDLTKRDAMSGQTYKRNLMLLDDYSVRITREVIMVIINPSSWRLFCQRFQGKGVELPPPLSLGNLIVMNFCFFLFRKWKKTSSI